MAKTRLTKAQTAAHQRRIAIEAIAQAELRIDTLESRNSDNLDFPCVAVWALKMALELAYEAGREAAGGERQPPTTGPQSPFPGQIITRAQAVRLFGEAVVAAGGGWTADKLVYGTATDGSDWRIGEVRGERASWNF